jgi:hypothetical protein
MNRKIAGFITGAAMVGSLAAVPALASSASASTAGCTGGVYAGSCADEVNMYGNGFDVYKQTARADQPVTSYPDFNGSTEITTDPGTDFYAENTTPSNADERVFEYAPNGKLSGFCISDPDNSSAPGGKDALQLRPCNGSVFQQFTGLGNTQDENGIQWQSNASKGIIQPNGTNHQMSTVKTVTNVDGSYWGWDQPGVPPTS